MSIDYEEIKRLVRLVEGNGLAELTIEQDDITVTIKAETAVERISVPVTGASEPSYAEQGPEPSYEYAGEEPAAVELEAVSENRFEIKSPMIGVYYRCPSPDSPPFVEIGEQVEAGQTIGLIEAMKVFSEIPSEVSGRVVEAPVGNGKLVQQGDVILVLDTSATA